MVEGWTYVGRTPLVRGLVLGMLGAFAAGGAVIGLARTFVTDLGAGDPGYGLLFGTVFLGLALGMLLGPRLLPDFSRRRLFGLSIFAAGLALALLALIPNMVIAVLVTLVLGAFAGVAWVTGYTLLGLEVADELRGRTFAFVQTIGPGGAGAGAGGRAAARRRVRPARDPGQRRDGADLQRRRDHLPGGRPARRRARHRVLPPPRRPPWGAGGGRRRGGLPQRAGGPARARPGGSTASWSRSRAARVPASPPRREPWRPGSPRWATTSWSPTSPARPRSAAGCASVLLDPTGDDGGRTCAVAAGRGAAVRRRPGRARRDASSRPALALGHVVVTDRYVDSSVAYQGAGRDLAPTEVARLSRWATEGLVPDLTVVLDLPGRRGAAPGDRPGPARGRAAGLPRAGARALPRPGPSRRPALPRRGRHPARPTR